MNDARVLRIGSQNPVTMLEHIVTGPRAWKSRDVCERMWRVEAPLAAQHELNRLMEHLDLTPLPMLALRPDLFNAPALAALMVSVREQLRCGIGFAVLDCPGIRGVRHDLVTSLFWILGQLLSNPVATKWDGCMAYEVSDHGRPFGHGVRGSATAGELSFHTDNGFGVAVPDYVGLLCLQQAPLGGLSRVCSLYSAHNKMLLLYPKLLKRLYQPAYYDRQAEHHPAAPRVLSAPLFRYDGDLLWTRLTPGLIRTGYALMGLPMDDALVEALATLESVVAHDELFVEFHLEPGHIQYLDNRTCAHYRSAFIDSETISRRLIRVWYRDKGAPFYDG